MKITIHPGHSTPAELHALAAMLTTLAGSIEVPHEEAAEPAPIVEQVHTPAPVVEQVPAPAPVVEQAHTPEPTPEPDAAAVFMQGPDSTPPAAPAPTASDTTPPVNEPNASTSTGSAAAVELDKDGLPWDARIHAGTRSKCADGSWKKKRGVHDAVVEQVTAELRTIMAVPGPAPAVEQGHTPPPAAAGFPPPVASMTPPPVADGAAPMPPFPALMRKITGAQTAGKLNPAQILAAIQGTGLQMLPDLLKRPDLIPQVEAVIDQYIASAPV